MPPPLTRLAAASLARNRLFLSRFLPQIRPSPSSNRAFPPFPTGCFPSRPYSSSAAERDKRSQRTLFYLVGVACAMVGASYAAVPLYRRFCQATGYGGTVQRREVGLKGSIFFIINLPNRVVTEFMVRDKE